MEKYELNNGMLKVVVGSHGGELLSVKRGDCEYIWQGDEAFWGRHAPILFPNVGKLWNNEFRVGEDVYMSKQHGFARDSEFVCVEASRVSLTMRCEVTGPLKNYPYRFQLEVRYRLEEHRLLVDWVVRNMDDKRMYFQIGAHPGFYYRDYREYDAVHGYMRMIDEGGVPLEEVGASFVYGGYKDSTLDVKLKLDNGCLALENESFARDAIIIERNQVKRVELLDRNGDAYLAVDCDCAEVFGLWGPHKKGCPFVCIEPWCGRTDRVGYIDDISKRDYEKGIDPGKVFVFGYVIEII